MKTHSGSTSEGYLPTNMTGNNGTTAVAPAPEDPTTTFSDHLEQQGSSGTATPQTAPAAATTWANATLAVSATPHEAATIPSLSIIPPTTAAATNLQAPATATTPTLPSSPLLTTLAATLAANAAATVANPPATSPPAATTAKTPKNLAAPEDDTNEPAKDDTSSGPNTKQSATSTPVSLLNPSDLSIMLARAAMLAANAKQTSPTTPAAGSAEAAASSSEESEASLMTDDSAAGPALFTWGSAKPTGTSTTEKKSAGTTPERSFIQADTSASSGLGMLLIAPLAALYTNIQTTNNQSLASSAKTTTTDATSAPGGALASAGMTSGKKENEMNATLDLTDLMANTGTSSAVSRPPADINILLGTNNDFKDALAQVMHVAELSNMSSTTPPLRIAIEVQTPPGAVVNVFVSKQPDDTYRAQLSTDDVQALHWVQDQIGSLKESTDTGVSVKWLPAQLETTTASNSSSSSSQQDSPWNRGGQGWQSSQQQQEQAEERRQKRGSYAGLLTPELSIPFIGALGRAA
jgi:hypothetical protein